MRLPKIGPTFDDLFKKHGIDALNLSHKPGVRHLVDKANGEYLSWHKFRYQPIPDDVSVEQAWTLVKLGRRVGRRQLDLADTQKRHFSYWLPNAFLGHLHEIDVHGGGEIGMAQPGARGAMRERFLVSAMMEEAIASGQIEGAATTRRAAKEMLRAGRKPRDRSERMILNTYNTVHLLKEMLDRPLTPDMLREIQASVTQGTLKDESAVGRFRLPREDDIGVYSEDVLLHQPPPAETLVDRLDILCAYANSEADKTGKDFEHPVIRAIMLHFWLGYEHPFADGNGRTARALFHWQMLRSGYWLFEYTPVSPIIRGSVSQYLRAFYLSEQDENDATYFIAYHLRAIRLALRHVRHDIERKQREMELRVNSIITGAPLRYRQQALLVHALKNPGAVYTAISHGTSHGVTLATARGDLAGLQEMGLLQKGREGRQHIWIAPRDLEERLTALGLAHARGGTRKRPK